MRRPSLRHPSRLCRALVVLVTAGVLAQPATSAAGAAATPTLDVDPWSAPARAAARDARFAPIGSQQVGTWLTEYFRIADRDPARDVRTAVRNRLAGAAQRGGTALLVLYAVPMRDCTAFSAGGWATHTAYRQWVDQVVLGIRDVPGSAPAVVVEPDALAMLGACSGQGDRVGSLRYAAQRLAAAGAFVYLDAGNSTWIPPGVMAGRLVQAGVAAARGFSTNVSNFRSTAAETAFAESVNSSLAAAGVAGRHYVIDTSRNGAPGAVPAGTWCNPRGARLGAAPRVVGGAALDALLWVKPPGESDGQCGLGDPAAGSWWDTGALRLLGYGV